MAEAAPDGVGDAVAIHPLDEHVRDTAAVGAAALVAVGLLQTIFVAAGATGSAAPCARAANGNAPIISIDPCATRRRAAADGHRGTPA